MYSFETASSFAFCPTKVLQAFLTSGKCAASPAFLILYLSTNYIEWRPKTSFFSTLQLPFLGIWPQVCPLSTTGIPLTSTQVPDTVIWIDFMS